MPVIQLSIESVCPGGDGLGREAITPLAAPAPEQEPGSGGRVVFVPRTAAGDEVEVEITRVHKRYARGRMLRLLRPSPDRVDPDCPAFAAGCGGCDWRHLSLEAQRQAKHAHVTSALRPWSEFVTALATPVPAEAWRRRARLHWQARRQGPALIGFYQQRSRRIIDVEHCAQLVPALNLALARIRGALAGSLRKSGEITLQASDEDEVLVALSHAQPRAEIEKLIGPPIVGVRAQRTHVGRRHIDVDEGVTVDATDFAQASSTGNTYLRQRVLAIVDPRPDDAILELFAGHGNFTRDLSRAGAQVTACDRVATHQQVPGFVRGDAAEIARRFAPQHFRTVLLDPPRSGARDVMPEIRRLAPDRVVYVSCDAATLGRDLHMLAPHYAVSSIEPIDLMPQTSQVEVLATLETP